MNVEVSPPENGEARAKEDNGILRLVVGVDEVLSLSSVDGVKLWKDSRRECGSLCFLAVACIKFGIDIPSTEKVAMKSDM